VQVSDWGYSLSNDYIEILGSGDRIPYCDYVTTLIFRATISKFYDLGTGYLLWLCHYAQIWNDYIEILDSGDRIP
jgi:hypothetical protein